MKISQGTLIRTVLLILALINNILTLCGRSPLPIDSDELTNLLSGIFTITAALPAWWKNNSFTSAALHADVYLQSEKESMHRKED